LDIHEPLETIEQLKNQVQHICEKFGLFGNVYYYEPSTIPTSNRNRVYVLAGTDPAIAQNPPPKRFHPEEIIRRNNGDELLFYPDAWALDLFAYATPNGQMRVYEQLVDYCKKASFLHRVYAEHGLSLPNVIREAEIRELRTYCESAENPALPEAVRKKCKKDLEWFFSRETGSGLRRRWLDYFRSDKYPDGKGAAAKIRGYLNRKKPEMPLDLLLEVCSDTKKLEMQEHEYVRFKKFMEDCYADISYAVGEKTIIDRGTDNRGEPALQPFGRRITSEEFSALREERFAEDGWACLADLKPSYWEFRDVHYKESDEPIIASVYQAVTLDYARPNDLRDVLNCGPIDMISVSATDFMNFVALAKANHLRFYIDKQGDFATPDLEYVNVIYNQSQFDLVSGITERMLHDKVEYSHLLDPLPRPRLSDTIQSAECQPRSTPDAMINLEEYEH